MSKIINCNKGQEQQKLAGAVSFDKYGNTGAYHWRECDPCSPVFNPALVARYAMILSRATGDQVIDIGAGDGYLTACLAEQCKQVVGVESEEDGVLLAQQMLGNVPNANVEKGSAYSLPYPENTFDAVVMADVIEHLDDPHSAVAEMARVARPQSMTYVTTPQWRPDRVWDVRHIKEYRPEEFVALMETSFDRVEMVYSWPRWASDLYRTRVGWRLMRIAGRHGINPFLRESRESTNFCQMMAIASGPR